MSYAALYKWCSKSCGIDVSQMKRMKELQNENCRLKMM